MARCSNVSCKLHEVFSLLNLFLLHTYSSQGKHARSEASLGRWQRQWLCSGLKNVLFTDMNQLTTHLWTLTSLRCVIQTSRLTPEHEWHHNLWQKVKLRRWVVSQLTLMATILQTVVLHSNELVSMLNSVCSSCLAMLVCNSTAQCNFDGTAHAQAQIL